MKRMSLLVALSIAIAPLSGCTNPQDEFDAAFALAQESYNAGDFEMAQAHLADALEAVPGSSAGETLRARVDDAIFSQETFAKLSNQAQSADWDAVLTLSMKLDSRHPDYEAAKSIASENMALNMTRVLQVATEFPAEAAVDLELMLIRTSVAQNWGLSVPVDLLEASEVLVVLERGNQLREILENDGAESALTKLEELLDGGFYNQTNFGAQIEVISDAYVSAVVLESKALTKSKKLNDAVRLMLSADKRLPNTEALVEERKRVAELVREEEESQLRAAEAAQEKAVKAMYVKEDTFENVKWYYDRASYSQYAGNKFLLYMGKREGGTPWLKLRFMMFDDSWHFFERIVVDVDGAKFNFNPGYFDVNRDNGSGDIWEWYDLSPSASDLTMLEKIIDSDKTRIRYVNDDNFYEERTVTAAQKRGLANVLLAFEALGGKR